MSDDAGAHRRAVLSQAYAAEQAEWDARHAARAEYDRNNPRPSVTVKAIPPPPDTAVRLLPSPWEGAHAAVEVIVRRHTDGQWLTLLEIEQRERHAARFGAEARYAARALNPETERQQLIRQYKTRKARRVAEQRALGDAWVGVDGWQQRGGGCADASIAKDIAARLPPDDVTPKWLFASPTGPYPDVYRQKTKALGT